MSRKNNHKQRLKQKQTFKYLKEYFPHKWASYKSIPEDELAKKLALIPPDTRDLTGKLLGDPIPNDRRRPWLCKNTIHANSAKNSR